MTDGAYPLIDLEETLDEARGWIRKAIDDVEDCGDESPEDAAAYFDAICRVTPGLRELVADLKAMEARLKDAFSPEMKEQLKREREQYDDEADRWEAQMYR